MGAPGMREALGEWPEEPIDELITRVRNERGKTQEALVEALCEASGNPSVDRTYVFRWERGRRIPTPYWRRHLATVLEIPLDVLDRACALARAQRATGKHLDIRRQVRLPASPDSANANVSVQSPQFTGSVALTATWAATPRSIGDAMDRAKFLNLMGATVAGAFAEEAFELLRFTESPGPSKTTVSILEQTVSSLDETYCTLTVPAQQLVGPVGQHLATARRMLGSSPGAERERLYTVASQAATLLGCLAFDLHDPHHARLYLHTAEQAAYEAGHPAMASLALSNGGWHALVLGDTKTSAQLIRHAKEVSAHSAPAPLQAWVAAMEARALADLGNTHACKQALDAAAAEVSRGRPPGAVLGGMTFFGADRLVVQRAMCHAHLGETEAARFLLAEAEAAARPEQLPRRASIRLEIATTYAREGDAQQASEIAIQALDLLPRERQVAGVTSRAKRLDAQLMTQRQEDPAVREFHERVLTV